MSTLVTLHPLYLSPILFNSSLKIFYLVYLTPFEVIFMDKELFMTIEGKLIIHIF